MIASFRFAQRAKHPRGRFNIRPSRSPVMGHLHQSAAANLAGHRIDVELIA
jgi:hypothetical protein